MAYRYVHSSVLYVLLTTNIYSTELEEKSQYQVMPIRMLLINSCADASLLTYIVLVCVRLD